MTIFPPLPPPVDVSRPPAFHDWNESSKRFERLAAALLDLDPRFEGGDAFGITGVSQYGVDALATSRNGGGRVVQSSKCYPKVTPAKLKGWSNEFLKHVDGYWAGKTVSNFILATAAQNLTTVELRKQIETETKRFSALGIAYEVWGPEQLWRKLYHHRGVICRFLGPIWAGMMLGPDTAAAPLSAALVAQLAQAQGDVAQLTVAQLARGELALCEEGFGEVETILATLQQHAWAQLTAPLQAKVLTLAGELAHARGQASAAETHCAAAQALDPSQTRLAASLAARTDDQEALRILGTPTDRRGRELKAALHLQIGELESAEALIANLRVEAPCDPEVLRLQAYAHLARDRRQAALETALEALTAAPRWRRNLEAVARMRYSIGFSPLAPLGAVTGFEALPWPLVKTDRASLAQRREAAEAFAKLSNCANAHSSLAVFHLASLACLPDQQDEAARLAADLLADNPFRTDVLDWVVGRSYAVDLESSRLALEARVISGDATPSEIAFCAVLLAPSDVDRPTAAAFLREHRDGLTQQAREAADLWIARLAGEATVDDPVLPYSAVTAAVASGEADDYRAIEALLSETLGSDPPELAGFNIAQEAAQRQWWSLIVPHGQALQVFETLEPLQLAILALHHTADPQAVVDLIARSRPHYSDDQWPVTLRRVEIDNLSRAGDLPSADRLVEALAAETGAPEDRRLLARLKVGAGDTKAATPLVRRLLRDGDLSADDAIRFSLALTREDRPLARDLWRRARGGVSDGMALMALGQAFKLGLDKEAGPLVARLQRLSTTPASGVWRATTDDLPEMMRRQTEAVGLISDLFLDGALTRHSAAQTLSGALSPLATGSAIAGHEPQQAVLLRHGGRPLRLGPSEPWSDWRILLDVTGLFSAQALDLLDALEETARPIGVSPRLIDVLYSLESKATHQQLARIDAGEAILAAVAALTLAVVEASEEAQTVRHDRDRRAVSQPGPTLKSVERLLAVLRGAAPGCDEVDGDAAEDETDLVATPPPGDRLVFSGNTLETLALQGALEAALRHFDCAITAIDRDRIIAEVAAAKVGDRVADDLAALRARIALGLQTGLYMLVADSRRGEPPEAGDDHDEEEDTDVSLLETSLFDIIGAAGGPSTMAWIDDRHISSYVGTGGARVVGAVEVINALEAAGALSVEAARERFQRLRAAGAVFIPLSVEEVLPPLLAAPIIADKLIETAELATLRRNLALGSLLDPHLKLGASAHEVLRDRPDEQHFLQISRKVVLEGLEAIWRRGDAPADDCRARADWLWSALRIERCVRALPGDDAGVGNVVLTSLLTASCLAAPANWIIGNSLARTIERQEQYFDWMLPLLWHSGRARDDAFADQVAAQVRALMSIALDRRLPDEARKIAVRLRQEVLSRYPDDLRQRILADGGFAEAVGITVSTSLTLGEATFFNTPFWAAAGRALRHGQARVISQEGRRLSLVSDGDDLVLQTSPRVRIHERFFDLLTLAPRERRREAARRIATLDLAPADLQGFLDRAEDLKCEADVAVLFHDAARLNARYHYTAMAETYGDDAEYPVEYFLPPRADRLLHALRLGDLGAPWSDRVATAWSRLADEKDSLFAFTELAGLPVDLASLALGDLPDWSRLPPPVSPMARLHLAASERRLGEDPNPRLQGLLETANGEGWLFVVLLGWSLQAFQADQTWREMEVPEQLALIWTHAHRITCLVSTGDESSREIAKIFLAHDPLRTLSEVLSEPGGLARDCAGPPTLQPPTLIAHGLAYVFGEAAAWPRLTADNQDRLARILLVKDDEQLKVTPAVFNRTEMATNTLQSWLMDWPGQLLEDELEPEGYRAAQIDGILDSIEADPFTGPLWDLLAQVARPALTDAQIERLNRIFDPLELWRMRRREAAPAADLIAFVAPVRARVRLGGPADRQQLVGKLHALSSAIGKAMPGPVRLKDLALGGAQGDRARAFYAVAEVMGELGRAERSGEALAQLHEAAMAIVHGWPAAAPALREVFDSFVTEAPVQDLAHVWRTFVALRAWS